MWALFMKNEEIRLESLYSWLTNLVESIALGQNRKEERGTRQQQREKGTQGLREAEGKNQRGGRLKDKEIVECAAEW